MSIFLCLSCVTTGPPDAPKTILLKNGGRYHRVVGGEDLFEIARKYNVSMHYLAKANNMNVSDTLNPGKYLYIPPKETAKSSPAKEAPAKVASSAKKTTKSSSKELVAASVFGAGAAKGADSIEKKNQKTTKTSAIKSEHGYIWPLQGKISRGFKDSATDKHKGIDILAPTGTAVVAAKSGVVIYEGNSIPGYGNLIIIDHGEDYVTLYGHNSKNLVEVNQKVKQGENIAQVGMTGRATAPHLHFEIRKSAIAVDPTGYLP